MKEHYDFSNGRRNTHAEKIRAEGYSVTIHYTPQDVTDGLIDDTKDRLRALIELMPAEDSIRLLAHIRDNYDLPCSPDLWDIPDKAHVR